MEWINVWNLKLEKEEGSVMVRDLREKTPPLLEISAVHSSEGVSEGLPIERLGNSEEEEDDNVDIIVNIDSDSIRRTLEKEEFDFTTATSMDPISEAALSTVAQGRSSQPQVETSAPLVPSTTTSLFFTDPLCGGYKRCSRGALIGWWLCVDIIVSSTQNEFRVSSASVEYGTRKGMLSNAESERELSASRHVM